MLCEVVPWERWNHSLTIQIVGGVQVHNIVLVPSRVISGYIWVVCLVITIADHGNTAMDALFNKQVHVMVG